MLLCTSSWEGLLPGVAGELVSTAKSNDPDVLSGLRKRAAAQHCTS